MDPANVSFFPNERFKASLVDIPADKPLIHALRDVPHGTVSYKYYPSLEGTTGSVVVYTPPGYNQSTERYRVYIMLRLVGPLIEELLGLREAARARRDFATADAIRTRLAELGISVEDTPQGARWHLARG
jgi:hypothetical protein